MISFTNTIYTFVCVLLCCVYFHRTSRIHSTISTILQLVPTADNNLYPIIQRHIPYSRSAIQKLEWYAKQCLAVVSYCPKFHKQIICLLVEKCLEIDVEIKVENGGKASLDVKEDEEEDCYEGEMFGIEIDISNNSAKKKKKDEVKVEVDEMAERVSNTIFFIRLLWIRHNY